MAGKRENGRISVSARQSGNQIIIEIVDDGRGIDTERLIQKLVAIGARDERDLRALSERQKLELVFEPGLSSKDEVTEISGRGVGMDVVKACIDQIGGRIELDSVPGRGLRVAIHVPLTLSIIPTIVVGVGAQRFAISRQAIEEIVTERSDAIRIDLVGDTPVATVRERRLPLVDLGGLLGIARARPEEPLMLVIVSIGEGSYALAVETVLDNEELVIKPAAPAVMSTGLYAGQTLPDSGLPMLLLDCAGIACTARLEFGRPARIDAEEAAEAEAPGLPALLFDDLDGVRRAVPLGVVDRVEQIPGDAVRFSAGRLRLAIDDHILPLVARAEATGREALNVLRFKDGTSEVAYAIEEALDIVTLPDAVVPSVTAGPVAGVVLLDGEQIELVDVHWVFAEHGDAERDGAVPLCLLSGDSDGWMASFVRPLLEAAGYRVTTRLGPGEAPAVVLASEGAGAEVTGLAPLVRLRRSRGKADAGDDSVYRYDRAGLLSALQAKIAAQGNH